MTYDIESIVIKVLANNSGNLIIPLKGYSTSGRTDCPYSWKVSVDEGTEATYSGTGGGTLTIATGLVAGSEHLVVIKPTTVAYQRARAFGTDSGDEGPYITEVVQDLTYIGFGVSATDTGGYFRYTQYSNCTEIVKAPEEVMPDTVTTIGYGFRLGQYWNAQKLVKAPKEVMSNNVTTIGDKFRAWMYQDCSLIETCPEEYLSSSLVSIGHSFREGMFYDSKNIKNTANEYLPEGLQTIGNKFRRLQYKGTGISKTAKEIMPDSITNIGINCRLDQYYDCSFLQEITGETKIKNAIIGAYYRAGMYVDCANLVKAKLSAETGLTGYRNDCFSATTNPMTITILGDVVDNPTINSGGLTNASVEKIYVDSSLVSVYQNSSSWSNISDDKFVAIPSISGNIDTLLFNDTQNVLLGTKKIGTQRLILNGTENRVWNSGNNRVILSVQGTFSLYSEVYCTHGPLHPNNSSVKDDGWCTYSGILCCYTTQNSLNDFKAWLAQEYSDGTPVIVFYKSNFRTINITPIDLDTKNGENLIEITQGGPNVNNLQAQITVEQTTGGYTANMFNGEDYSVESNWIEISEQEEDEGGDVVGPNSSTDGNVALFDGTTGKLIKDSGVSLSNKQDTLVSGTNIKTINSTSLLGSGDVTVQETLVSGTNIKTVNNTSILGSGNIDTNQVSDVAYSSSWDGVTTIAPSKNAVYDKIESLSGTIPTVNDGTISFTQGGVAKGDFTTNQATAETIALEGNILTTQTDYDNLPSSKLTDNNFYIIYSS